MKNTTQSLKKLQLSKIKIAKLAEQEKILGGNRRTRRTNSKTGDTRMNEPIQSAFQMQDVLMIL